ncbi:MAG: hypothetical protein IJQ81_02900 [Oscillibacter sp.]|nr:hypothetical protein [Oscillibacter sp.]
MRTRLELHEKLLDILVALLIRKRDGSGHLYFQPPETVKMAYPAVVYSLSNIQIRHADNQPYKSAKQYQITAIDKDPDSALPERIAELPTARFNRFFVSDNLNHWVFTVYV